MAKNYEQTHPVLGIRVSQELYDEIQERRRNGQSYGDILRLGLDKQQVETAPLMERIEELELEALQLDELVEKRTVTYPCSRCGKPIKVQSDREKEVCIQALIKAGFYHRTCPS
jgi:NADH pyrophosphatase NudC (nudix superfamily)